MVRRALIHPHNPSQKAQAAWLLALLVLLASTLPSLSAVRLAADGTFRIEVCSTRNLSDGLISLSLASRTEGLGSTFPGQHSARPHCLLCISSDVATTVPLPDSRLVLARIDLVEHVGSAATRDLPPSPRQSLAQSRAPPISA
jgi:hypothetical protein